MAEARMRDEWARTSSLLALIANAHRDPKKTRAFKPGDFDPFARRIAPLKVGVEVLKDVFLHGKVPEQVGNREDES
ncbi:MAG: hypothetical protein L6Q92_16510 [Phycisphaerae bacterium]|nr:hypothetical protein [Phycisphaerae bacterium]